MKSAEQVDHHQRNGSVLSLLVSLVCTPPWPLLFSACLLQQCPACEHSWFSSAVSFLSVFLAPQGSGEAGHVTTGAQDLAQSILSFRNWDSRGDPGLKEIDQAI